MNRNAESHFAELPHANIERSRFDRSHSVKFTGNVGEVIPFLCDPVLPGDTWEIDTSKILRLQTMVSPVMDGLFLDVYYFFVPNRLLWVHWKEFCGENTQTSWYPSVSYSIPKIAIGLNGVDSGSLLDALGIPPTVNQLLPGFGFKVNALRLRGYLKIMNEWFRDQNVENPLNFFDGDSDTQYDSTTVEGGGKLYVAAKMHDYFTSCLPGPQKALNPVQIPTSGFLNVEAADPNQGGWLISQQYPMVMGPVSGSTGSIYGFSSTNTFTNTSGTNKAVAISPNVSSANYAPENLIVRTGAAGSVNAGLSISVTDLRLAFQTQKFLEKQARGGSRYREILLSHFGVTSPDARQQVPEYLGGNRIPLNITQVVNQAETANQPLGNLGAYSQTTDVHHDVFKSFTEHGYIYGLAVVRYDHTYAQSIERDWFIDNIYDMYWPVFAHISEQPVYTKELYAWKAHDGSSAGLTGDVFGYQEAWAQYRYKLNRCFGEMRPQVANGLSSWSFADVYTSQPYLSASWIKEDKANVDRALAVTSAISDQFWADFYIKCITTRPMPLYSVPGLVDHF